MSDVVIRVRDLGKQYKLKTGPRYKTLRDELTNAVGSMLRRERKAPAGPGQFIWALRHVDFEVRAGQVVGIIGKNGAGKSTLLKILSRVTTPTSGYADIRGRVGSLLEVGTGFHPQLTGRENVFLSGAILGMKNAEIKRKFDEIVAFSEVEKFIDTPVKHYSSGMFLRLAFSTAVHMHTDILMIDELLSVGDAGFQERCRGKMREITQSGRTILLVSHNLPVISALAEKSILLEEGQVALYDDTQKVIGAYLTRGREGNVSLANRTERSGSWELKFTGVEVCDDGGTPGGMLRSGESAIIRLHYTCERPVRAWNLVLDMLLRDSLGFPVCTLSTRFAQPLEDETLDAQGALECYIPRLLLAEDSYSADIWCVLNNTIVDYVQSVSLPAVQSADFFGTGAMPVRGKHGLALIPHEWRIGRRETVSSGNSHGHTASD